ncbi:GUN4 domain-containing protein [Mastigocladopsis repens]|uniref:GUN4 domain-containing protein n=1 Tax=Mastigocladopsis repens TaxID=221287 RepID=UPI0022B39E4F|nr:GUN4 domain-containing protein [Mastigocladopsis repens]
MSACGVDYTRLGDLLAYGRWQEADQETEMVILKAAGREGNLLNVPSIQKLPARDLRTIDQLLQIL